MKIKGLDNQTQKFNNQIKEYSKESLIGIHDSRRK
jgi:hypothetical protein